MELHRDLPLSSESLDLLGFMLIARPPTMCQTLDETMKSVTAYKQLTIGEIIYMRHYATIPTTI